MTRRRKPIRSEQDFSATVPTPSQDDFFELYEKELQAYTDDYFLLERLTGDTRTLRKSPELRESLNLALMCEDDASLLEAASELEQAESSLPAFKSSIARTLDYLCFTQKLDQIKVDAVGFEASSDRANFLMASKLEQTYSSIPVEDVQKQHATNLYVQERLHTLLENAILTPEGHSYLSAKLGLFTKCTKHISEANNYVEHNLVTPDTHTYTAEEIEHDTLKSSVLFREIHQSRSYGLKLGYFPYEYGGSLVYADSLSVMRDQLAMHDDLSSINVHPLSVEAKKRVAFDIAHSAYANPRISKPEYLEASDATGRVVRSELAYKNLNIALHAFVGQDGELYLDQACRRPLAYDAAAHGKYEAYRRLQATIFAQYFDLTHASATERSEAMPFSPVAPAAHAPSDPMDTFRQLVMPRLTPQEAHHHAEASAPNEPVIKLHGVTYFTRKLPPGAQASPEAQRLAAEHNIILPEGKTFVRAHTRGSKKLGEVVAHKFIDI
jgi:hypothetical protein